MARIRGPRRRSSRLQSSVHHPPTASGASEFAVGCLTAIGTTFLTVIVMYVWACIVWQMSQVLSTDPDWSHVISTLSMGIAGGFVCGSVRSRYFWAVAVCGIVLPVLAFIPLLVIGEAYGGAAHTPATLLGLGLTIVFGPLTGFVVQKQLPARGPAVLAALAFIALTAVALSLAR